MTTDASPVQARKRVADKAWQQMSGWDYLYRDAYDFALPGRKPGGVSKPKQTANYLFDMTAPTSAMHLAGELQRLLFSQPPALTPGPVTRQAFEAQGRGRELAALERALEKTGEFIYPFMTAGDLETATHEMCIDLGIGTGIVIPMRGTPERPIIFFAPPADEVALMGDAYGHVSLASWKRQVELEALIEAFPKGNFSSEIAEKAKNSKSASTEVTLYQDFWRRPDGRWQFGAYIDRDCHQFIATEIYRTKPIATPRYYRVAGEMRGRGPVLLAMPSIKTVNKAQELALKSAAIQMLGIWGYRAGGAFNPDTAPMTPGSFWSMQSTGGILGPDVQRLDPAAGRLDVASMVIEGMQQQIRDALMDTRLQPETGTPRSASEIAARLQQASRVHLGGFMRLWREVYPDIVPRCAEILNSFGYLGGLMDFNELVVSVGVRSPMATAINADKVGNILRYAEIVGLFTGNDPSKLPEHLLVDDAMNEVSEALMIPKKLVPDADARAQAREAAQQAMGEQVLAEGAVKAAPQIAQTLLPAPEQAAA